MAFDATPQEEGGTLCPRCGVQFQPKRSNQSFCGRECQKATSRHAARGARTTENAQRNRDHYDRAAWLCYDLNRMAPWKRPAHLSKLIIAAKVGNAKLRNILTDPKLLAASRTAPIGKLYPDSHNCDVLNIAKEANAYCRERWSIGIKEAIGTKDHPPHADVMEEPEGELIGPVKETYWQRLRRERCL
ncbi:hypothetical protein [Paracoccus everestensis]|uniref:hypothetical protein n=1 Tax=Paracoccus everestensis TaxID=2903900 RepID=UPI001F23A7C2|nr:hypothetical protein [Paracoccus everestensis]